MKRLITTLLALMLLVVPSFASDAFNQEQADLFNEGAVVYLSCVVNIAADHIKEGHTPSYGVEKGAEACVDDAIPIIGILMELKATDQEINWVFTKWWMDTITALEIKFNEEVERQKKAPPKIQV